MHDLVAIDTRSSKVRLAIVTAALLALALGWFGVRWQLGDLLATLTKPTDPNAQEIADVAARWAPNDPAAYGLLASTAEDNTAAIVWLENAVRRSPSDYRYRVDLGRAYEQDGQVERAGAEFAKAVEIAPNYSFARWHLGNFLLRQERNAEAIAELRLAAENSSAYREQVFSLVWDMTGKDAGMLEQIAGDRPEMLARLAYFFAARGKADAALRTWNRLTADAKEKNSQIARSMALGLFDQKHFPEALEFARQYGAETDAKPESITNSSFDSSLGENEEARFGWIIPRSDPKFDAVADSRVKRDGDRSLRLTFKGFNKPTLSNVLQTIVVQPSTRYRLSVWVRTENLRSAGMPMIEIINAVDGSTLARSTPFVAGTSDWQQIAVDFATPATSTGVTLRTIREACGEDCPITGIVWYDAFSLERNGR